MSGEPKTEFTIVFEKLKECQDSAEARESANLARAAEEIQGLRRILEETDASEYTEYATT